MSTRGPSYAVNDEWRARVLKALEQLKMSQRDLAKAAGISPVTLTNLLQGRNKGSSAVPKIHRALSWPLPTIEGSVLTDERRERMMYIVRALPEDDFAAAESLLNTMWANAQKAGKPRR